MWKKRNLCALLVGMYISAAAMENSMEVPRKLNIELHMDQQFQFWVFIQGDENTNLGRACTPTFTAVLFTTAKTGNNGSVPRRANAHRNRTTIEGIMLTSLICGILKI